MICQNCASTLTLDETDSRQEWTREYYSCPNCKKLYERKTTYSQNGLVESDELKEYKEEK